MLITARSVSREFIRQGKGTNRFVAVKPTDISLESGRLCVLMGRSGSGKSTLLNLLSGLLTPTSGNILYDERDIYSLSDEELSKFRNANIGVIPQGQTAIQSLSVTDNICLSYMLYGKSGELRAARKEAEKLMERLGIAELKDVMPSELSGGELRRMAIARALLRKPAAVFADEPTCDLDDENTAFVLELLRETAHAGAAVFVVTHEKDAEGYADELFDMNAGELKKRGI